MTDREMLRRILEETKTLGGEKELYRQLSLNRTLEDRTIELNSYIEASRRTIIGLDKTLQGRYEDDRKSQQAHEELLLRLNAEQAQFINKANAQRTELTQELNGIKQQIATYAQKKARLETEIAIGHYFLSLIPKNPGALQLHEAYLLSLTDPRSLPDPQLANTLAYRLISTARDQFTRNGLLVPIQELNKAKRMATTALRQAENDRFLRNYMLRPLAGFVNNPSRMSTEQKRVLIEAYAQTRGDTLEGFAQLMKWIESSEVCVFHGCTMIFDYRERVWRCPVFTCTFKR